MRYLLILVSAVSFQLTAQQDPAAKEILDRVAAKTKQYKSIQADFKLIISDHKENKKSTNTGNVVVKGNKYKVTSAGTTVFFDGVTMWTYVEQDNEVTITQPDNQDDNFLSNPAKIFTWYNRDFKYQYRGETTIDGVDMHEIDLFPKNLRQPYSRIKVFITKSTEELAIVSAVGKEGIDYSVFLSNFSVNKEVPDSEFTFDTTKYKKVTVVDMRGL
jgi:outer membrane lipoprotein-sorting protein